jgi:hypothetical protein
MNVIILIINKISKLDVIFIHEKTIMIFSSKKYYGYGNIGLMKIDNLIPKVGMIGH